MGRVGLQNRVADLAGRYEIPGASVSVVIDGEVSEAVTGVVNLRTGVQVRPDSPFMIQSVTKVWTATLVMQLVDEGLVVLDEPVTRYLPGFRTASEPQSRTVTVGQLLTHTGGFEGDLWPETTCGADALQRFVDEHVARAAQHAPPGAFFSYCSAGIGVLGRLVESLRETTYADALRRYLTGPLAVEGVAFDAGEALAYRTAIGHVRGEPGEPLRPMKTWAVMPASNPAAGNRLAMPARGLLALARLHLADGLAPDGARLLSAHSARLMREPQVEIPATLGLPQHQGLGWRLTPTTGVVEHGGGAIGCGAMLRLVPDRGVAVAVVANGGDMSGFIAELCDGLLHEHAGVPLPSPTPVSAAAPVGDAARYVGRYELGNQVTQVTADEVGRLWLTVTERNEAVTMAELAGIRLQPETAQLRRVVAETFQLVDAGGHHVGVVEFIETDSSGRARYLHSGRAAPRIR